MKFEEYELDDLVNIAENLLTKGIPIRYIIKNNYIHTDLVPTFSFRNSDQAGKFIKKTIRRGEDFYKFSNYLFNGNNFSNYEDTQNLKELFPNWREVNHPPELIEMFINYCNKNSNFFKESVMYIQKGIEKTGEYLYLGMGTCNGQKVVLSVGYTPEYAHKKALQFEKAGKGIIIYEDVSKIKNGDKIKCETLNLKIKK